MMRAKFVLAFALLLPFFVSGPIRSADLGSPVGLWQAVDEDTKQPTGWFLISEHNGVYGGIIAKMYLKPGEDPNVVCSQCKDDRHNHPWLGLEIIRGMQQEGEDKYGGGTILDPRDGKVYKATMKLSPDSAYSMLDPSINPNPPANPTPAPNQKHPPPAHRSQLPPASDDATSL